MQKFFDAFFVNGNKCINCKFFSISWDINFPYHCSLLNIKSKKYPFLEVISLKPSKQCPFFVEKLSKKKDTKTSNDQNLDIQIE